MRLRITILLFFLILFPHLSIGQIIPDSLIGTYAGLRWFRWEEDTNWTIYNDTVYVTDINGTNCRVIVLSGNPWLGGTWIIFETQYSFCFGASTNLFHRFHPEDSLTIIYDDVSQPPPNYHPSSTRFYGKKICDSILIATIEYRTTIPLVVIYPNPFNTSTTISFTLDGKSKIQISIFNSIGEEVYNLEDKFDQGIHKVPWSPDPLAPGLYFAVLRSGDGVSVVKMVKE